MIDVERSSRVDVVGNVRTLAKVVDGSVKEADANVEVSFNTDDGRRSRDSVERLFDRVKYTFASSDVELPVVDHSTEVVEGPAVEGGASDVRAVMVDPRMEDSKSPVSNVLVERI